MSAKTPFLLPPLARKVLEVITKCGGRPLLVGGCVRDNYLGLKAKDIDIEVHGPVTSDALVQALSKHGFSVDTVGASFGVIKVGPDIDISFPRRDSLTGTGHTGFTVQVDQTMTVEEALSRRDFTINSMAYDPATDELIDPFGGRADMEARILRHTSPAFAEDPLRVLRAVQFAARFRMSLHPDTAVLCRGLVPRLVTEISVERFWGEWEKILSKGRSMKALAVALSRVGLSEAFGIYLPDGERADRIIKITSRGDVQERSVMILGSLFRDRPKDLEAFLIAVKAPGWLAKRTREIIVPFDGPVTPARARHKARQLAKVGIWMREYLSVWEADQETWDVTKPVCLGVKAPLLTGDMLIEQGHTPGPLFSVVLRKALWAQDEFGWTQTAEALAWLRT